MPAQQADVRRRIRRPDFARLGHAFASALVVGWGASQFPFYPAHTQILIAALAGICSYLSARWGNTLAFSLLLLPFGNYSFGLAFLFAVCTIFWLAFTWKTPRLAQLPVVGPLLTGLGGLFLLPLVVARVGGAVRRAVLVFVSFALALAVTGMNGQPFPLTGIDPPLGLGIESSTSPTAVAGVLMRTLVSEQALLAEGCLLALVAIVLPFARGRRRWGSVGLASAMIAGGLLPFPGVAAAPIVLGAWLTALALALPPVRVSGAHPAAEPAIGAAALKRSRIAV